MNIPLKIDGLGIGAVSGGVLGAVLGNQVGVRMDDGSRRTPEVSQSPTVGSKGTVEGSSIHSRDGGVYNA